MSDILVLDGGLSVREDDQATTLEAPQIPLTLSEVLLEWNTFKVDLAEGASDVAISLGQVDVAKYLLLVSDVVVQMKVNDAANDPTTGRRIYIEAGVATSLFLSNLGLLFAEGKATGGSATALNDTEQNWTYTLLQGEKVYPPFTFGEPSGTRDFQMRANGKGDIISLSASALTGAQMATAIQTAIDASEIGANQVAVTYDSTNERFLIANLVAGANAISITAEDGDVDILDTLGFVEPTSLLGGDSLVDFRLDIIGGTGSGQSKTVDSNTATSITPTANFSPAPDATSLYKVYKPQAGTVQVFVGK